MSSELNKLLIKAYKIYQNDKDPPIPVELIKEYLELEGVSLNDEEESKTN